MKQLILTGVCAWLMATVAMAQGHRFIASGSGMKHIVIVDDEGKVEWRYPFKGECNDLSMLSDSTILFSYREGARLINLKKETLWEYKGKKGTEVQSASPVSKNRFLIVQNGTPAYAMEIDRKGRIRKKFELPTLAKHPHAQFRNIRKTNKGTYLVGYFKGDRVAEFNDKGEEIKRFSVKGNNFSSVRLPNGHTLVGCGDNHRMVELDKEGNEVWTLEENDIPNHPLRFVSAMQVRENGNIVVTNWGGHGHNGGQAQVFEITRDKKVVWEINDWKNLGQISTIQMLDEPGRMEKGELTR
jgi:outer membrane protein assembly factor BamB